MLETAYSNVLDLLYVNEHFYLSVLPLAILSYNISPSKFIFVVIADHGSLTILSYTVSEYESCEKHHMEPSLNQAPGQDSNLGPQKKVVLNITARQ